MHRSNSSQYVKYVTFAAIYTEMEQMRGLDSHLKTATCNTYVGSSLKVTLATALNANYKLLRQLSVP